MVLDQGFHGTWQGLPAHYQEVARIWTRTRRNSRFPQVDVYFLSDERILPQILLDGTVRVIGQF